MSQTTPTTGSHQRPGAPQRSGYEEVRIDTLRLDSVLPFRLFTRIEGEFIVYRRENSPFTQTQRQALLENGIDVLYIASNQIDAYWTYLGEAVQAIVDTKSGAPEERASKFYFSVQKLSEKIYATPFSEESVEATHNLVAQNLKFVGDGKQGLHLLMRNMEQRSQLYTHSVHVCQYGLALCRELGISAQSDLEAMGMGFFLQDVGMLEIPQHLVYKSGPLSFEEWAQVKRHPALGIESLERVMDLPHLTRSIVASHHERLDGTGYPQGLSGKEVSPEIRIAGIVDTFCSLTSSRPFRDACATYDALSTMAADLDQLYDRTIFTAFVKLLGA
ncbi:MAG: HD-GYP domain-containing protein [Planctomycetota bacterium]